MPTSLKKLGFSEEEIRLGNMGHSFRDLIIQENTIGYLQNPKMKKALQLNTKVQSLNTTQFIKDFKKSFAKKVGRTPKIKITQ